MPRKPGAGPAVRAAGRRNPGGGGRRLGAGRCVAPGAAEGVDRAAAVGYRLPVTWGSTPGLPRGPVGARTGGRGGPVNGYLKPGAGGLTRANPATCSGT